MVQRGHNDCTARRSPFARVGVVTAPSAERSQREPVGASRRRSALPLTEPAGASAVGTRRAPDVCVRRQYAVVCIHRHHALAIEKVY